MVVASVVDSLNFKDRRYATTRDEARTSNLRSSTSLWSNNAVLSRTLCNRQPDSRLRRHAVSLPKLDEWCPVNEVTLCVIKDTRQVTKISSTTCNSQGCELGCKTIVRHLKKYYHVNAKTIRNTIDKMDGT